MSRRFIALLLVLFVAVALLFFFVLGSGLHLNSVPTPPPGGQTSAMANTPPVPPAPSVNLTVTTSSTGNSLLIQWKNLPSDTSALLIYRSLISKDDWSLWKTVAVSSSTVGDGEESFNIGKDTLLNYKFFVQATGSGDGSGSAGGSSNPSSTNVYWTSSVTTASTSTPVQTQMTGGGTTPGQTSNGNSTPMNTTSTSNTPPSNGSSTTPTSTEQNTTTTNINNPAPPAEQPPQTPSGTPYYTPQVTISGYGDQNSGSFWVQYADQKNIEFGWQDLPPPTTAIIISRSSDQAGPWSEILTMHDPIIAGPTSIQVFDDAVGQPFYYKMAALAGTTTIETFGPDYLPAN